MCRRMPAHGLYFCVVGGIHTIWWMVISTAMPVVVAILGTILTWSIYEAFGFRGRNVLLGRALPT